MLVRNCARKFVFQEQTARVLSVKSCASWKNNKKIYARKKNVKTKCPRKKKYFKKLVGKNSCSEKIFLLGKIFARKNILFKKYLLGKKFKKKNVLGKKIFVKLCSEK